MKRRFILIGILAAPALFLFDFWLAMTVGNWWNDIFSDDTGMGGFYVGSIFWFALVGSQAFVTYRLSEDI